MNKKYDIKATAQFKKDYKLAKKRGLDLKHLAKVINTLAEGEILPAKNYPLFPCVEMQGVSCHLIYL